MTTFTESDMRELKDLINSRFNELDKKINELDKKIEVNQAVTNEKFLLINEKFSSLNGRLDTMQASVNKIPELAEKIGELKKRCDPTRGQRARERAPRDWRQIAFVAITATIGGIVGRFARAGGGI